VTVAPLPDVEPALERLARALAAQEQAAAALSVAARRLAGAPGSVTALRAMSRAEVLERRARLHLELACADLVRRRAVALEDQRRVPHAFRRRPSPPGPSVEVVGSPVERDVPEAREVRDISETRDRAAS
jgi:hypothetical protein